MKQKNTTHASFRTEVVPQKIEPFVNPDSFVLGIGSCFADNIGGKLRAHGLRSVVNPFGVMYNPASIASTLDLCRLGTAFSADDLSTADDRWFSYQVRGMFSNSDPGECLAGINAAVSEAALALCSADVLILTLGTSYVYRLVESGEIVANCHKQPQRLFSRELVSHDQAFEILGASLGALLKLKPELKVILTVSPVRHLRDAVHENQISKSHLLILADQLTSLSSNVHYFPAYELMMDDLRDYRFYADDMIHPSPLAIDYIWTAVMNWCFSSDTVAFVERIKLLRQRLAHRSRNSASVEHARFMAQTTQIIEELIREFPTNPIADIQSSASK